MSNDSKPIAAKSHRYKLGRKDKGSEVKASIATLDVQEVGALAYDLAIERLPLFGLDWIGLDWLDQFGLV